MSDDGTTQVEMNQQAAADARQADTALNEAFQNAKGKLDATAGDLLRRMQQAWIAYRDAYSNCIADSVRGGSLEPQVRAGAMATETARQTGVIADVVKGYAAP